MQKFVFNGAVLVGYPVEFAAATSEVSVTLAGSAIPAQLWADEEGSTPLTNPFPMQSLGSFFFYADHGFYDISVSAGELGKTWYNEQIGSPISFSSVTETTAARTLGLTDHKKFVICSNASGCAITIPPQASVAWLDDTTITGVGTVGNCTFLAGSGVSIIKPEGRLLECYAGAPWALRRLSLNLWLLTGYLVEA